MLTNLDVYRHNLPIDKKSLHIVWYLFLIFKGTNIMNIIKVYLFTFVLLLSSCSRNLSSSVHTSDETLSLTMEGKVLSVRDVTIKSHDKLEDHKDGLLAGGLLGGSAIGLDIGGGSGQAAGLIGAAIAGATLGTIVKDKISTNQGKEYVIKVDTSNLKDNYYEGSDSMKHAISSATTNGLITVVQGIENPLLEGQDVYVMFSNKRTRVIPKNTQ